MTPCQLADEMASRGCPVSLRRLRDWRERKLLPALTQHGRGRGKGKQCYWEDPGIVDRAITVYELLERREWFPGAHYLDMWFAGYPADCNVIRKALLAWLVRTRLEWLRGATDPDGIENKLAPVSERVARRACREIGASYEDTQALVLAALNAYFNGDRDNAESPELIAPANAILRPKSPCLAINGKMLKAVLEFAADHISLDSQSDRISSATDADLDEAHRRWQAGRRVIGLLAAKHYQGEVPEDMMRTGRRLSVVFGGACIQVLIYLAKRGMGSLVDSKLIEAVDYVTQLSEGQGAISTTRCS